MLAIYKKELSSYFHTVIGWLFVAVNLFFISLYFAIYNLLYGSTLFSNAMSSCGFVILLSVPILSMRILAEERKNKTDQLILTAPITVGKIVAGKFFALATVFAIPCAISLIYPLIMKAFGTVPMAQAYTAILGYYLYGLAAIAVGIFISSLTDNQVIAAVLSFGTLFLLYMIGSIGSVIFSSDNLVKKLFESLDFSTRFYAFMEGSLDFRAIIYFISAILLVLYLTTQSIQKRRWSVSRNSIGTGAYSVTTILLAIGIFVLANLFATQIPEDIAKIDITPNKLFSLTSPTKEYLKELKTDVTIYVYADEDNYDSTVQQTLKKYEAESSHIKVEYRDPAKYPNFASEYTSDSISSGSLILVGNDRNKVIDYSKLYEQEFDYNTYSQTVTGYDGEGRITSAINALMSDDQPTIYFLSGHSELSLDSTFESAVEKANLVTEELNLMTSESIPENAAAVMVFGPSENLSADDVSKLKNYIDAGGNVLLVTNYASKSNENVKAFLSDYGLTLYDGLVADTENGRYYQDPFFLLPNIESSSYASLGSGTRYIFCPYAQGMTFDETNETYSVQAILSTSTGSVAKTNLNSMTTYDAEEGDQEGSFLLGAEVTKADGSGGKLIVFTSINQFSQSSDDMVAGANLQMFSNIISNYNTNEDTISIPVKSYTSDANVVPQKYFILVGLLTAVVVPLCLIIVGIVIWVRRRRR